MHCSVDIDETVAIATDVKNESSTDSLHFTMDEMLDAINSVKRNLSQRTLSVEKVIEAHDAITWIDTPNELVLEKVKTIVNLSEEVYTNWALNESACEVFDEMCQKNVAKHEIEEYKHALSDLRESIDDLNRIFFILPHDEDFQNAAKELEKLQ